MTQPLMHKWDADLMIIIPSSPIPGLYGCNFFPQLEIPTEFTHLLLSRVPFFLPNLQSYLHITHARMHAHTHTHTLLFMQLKTLVVVVWYRVGSHLHFVWPSWPSSSGSLLAHLRDALWEISKRNALWKLGHSLCVWNAVNFNSPPKSVKLHHCCFGELPFSLDLFQIWNGVPSSVTVSMNMTVESHSTVTTPISEEAEGRRKKKVSFCSNSFCHI